MCPASLSTTPLEVLVATCAARGINPFAYLADIPKRRLDELSGHSRARAHA
jgi:hypothetical protein